MIEEIKIIAEAAGKAIMQIYNAFETVESSEKDDKSPLTNADLAAHYLIIQKLSALYPSIPILSEESKTVSSSKRVNWEKYWLVDPLDGTKEFLKRNGEFTVNIALIEEGTPILGVVCAPAKDLCFGGVLGSGAWLETVGTRREIHCGKPELSKPVRVVASRSHRGEEVDHFLRQLGNYECIPMGSSLKICLVAAGEADLYPRLGPTMEWDTAAAHAVVIAAGGCVSTIEGLPLLYNKENLLNPYFVVHHSDYLDWLKYV